LQFQIHHTDHSLKAIFFRFSWLSSVPSLHRLPEQMSFKAIYSYWKKDSTLFLKCFHSNSKWWSRRKSLSFTKLLKMFDENVQRKAWLKPKNKWMKRILEHKFILQSGLTCSW
jgi:hypothetical protein